MDDSRLLDAAESRLLDAAESRLLDAAEAYEAEKERWGVRINKVAGCYEIFRHQSDWIVDPRVMASMTGKETAEHECQEMSFLAAMKAAAEILDS